MADTEPQALPIPDNDDVKAEPVEASLLDRTEATLGNPDAKIEDLGEDGLALIRQVIAEMKARQSVAVSMSEDSDGLLRQTEGSGEAGELSPEQVTFMEKLKARYESNQHHIACHDSVAWATVEAKLSANPAKLDALKKMDDLGGEPDMTGVEGGEFLFDDLAARLPDSRRGVTYAQAAARAEAMGGRVKLTHPDRYKKLGNEMRIVMDTGNDWVWLDTSDQKDVLDAGGALCGFQGGGNAYVGQDGAYDHDRRGAFRCSLRV
jgi:Protein of unknown function (DUF4256)